MELNDAIATLLGAVNLLKNEWHTDQIRDETIEQLVEAVALVRDEYRKANQP